MLRLCGPAVKTQPSHGCYWGSIPHRVTNTCLPPFSGGKFYIWDSHPRRLLTRSHPWLGARDCLRGRCRLYAGSAERFIAGHLKSKIKKLLKLQQLWYFYKHGHVNFQNLNFLRSSPRSSRVTEYDLFVMRDTVRSP